MPLLPVAGLILGMCAVAGVALMIGLRLSMRRQVEPLSGGGRRLLWGMLASAAAGVGLLYLAVRHLLASGL